MARGRKRIKDYACLDLDRENRTGIPEVVIAEGKDRTHLLDIIKGMLERKGRAIVTRVPADIMPDLMLKGFVQEAHPEAGICVLKRKGLRTRRHSGVVAILAAGTSDFRVGEEARIVAEELGCKVRAFYDVGVAGVHRLFEALDDIDPSKVDAFIVIAGREGALPTLVSGLVDAPVIGVPVSTGYGKGGRGEAALMAMLQSCSPLVVVNIDAGFIAGAVASRIAARAAQARAQKVTKERTRKEK